MQEHTYEIMNRSEEDHWWFVGRRAILAAFLEAMTAGAKTPNLKILDVGCGTGANLELLGTFGDAEGVDISETAVTYCANKGLNVQKGSAEALPYPDDSFDIVTGLDVIEHLEKDVAGLAEMNRVLKPGGKTLIFVPAFMWLWGVQDDVSEHKIRYTKPQIKDRLTEAGFNIERTSFANFTFFLPILLGRMLMRLSGFRPKSENNLNLKLTNGLFGSIFSFEAHLLKHFNFPIGVSLIVIASKPQKNS